MKDLSTVIEENRLMSFIHFVSAKKKQDKNTVTYDEDVYTYTTKRGIIKRYRYYNNIREYLKAKDDGKSERVNGFVFVEVKE